MSIAIKEKEMKDNIVQLFHSKPESKIELFFHCDKCIKEKPEDISPRDYAELEAGWTEQGFQVWCKRHEMNIIHVDFEGQQHQVI